LTRDQLKARIEQNSNLKETVAAFGGNADNIKVGEVELDSLGSMTGRAVTLPPPNPIAKGRNFSEADAGRQVIVMPDSQSVTDARLQVGDKLTYQFGDGASAQQVTFELIGITQPATISDISGGNGTLIPLDGLPASIQPSMVEVLANVDKEAIPILRRNLSS